VVSGFRRRGPGGLGMGLICFLGGVERGLGLVGLGKGVVIVLVAWVGEVFFGGWVVPAAGGMWTGRAVCCGERLYCS